jgi:capsid protein
MPSAVRRASTGWPCSASARAIPPAARRGLPRPRSAGASPAPARRTCARHETPKLILGGDFYAGYTIVDRLGLTAEIVPHVFGATNRFPLGMRGLYAYGRTGANVVAPNLFRYLEVK